MRPPDNANGVYTNSGGIPTTCRLPMVDADIACAVLLSPVFPNQVLHSTAGPFSYALAVLHKGFQAELRDGVEYDAFLKESPFCTPRDWVRQNIWNTAYNTTWELFQTCGKCGDNDPRTLFPRWMRSKGLSDKFCKDVCGYDSGELHAYN